ncbi:SDR family oxidoreductase [Micromonospora sp. NPDC007271]|uniref:SDR family oxidoreductase n=1 Tax=Micromonospora sp. NPDC007271 TaxID=3154587 RepID=UPI0033DBAD7D
MILDSFSLAGEVAFVTGAGRGIGQRIAMAFAEAGADVACFDLDVDAAKETAAGIERLGRGAMAFGGDVTDAAALRDAVSQASRQLGPVSVALNNAGIAHLAPAEEMDPADWRRMIDVNLTGVFLSAQAEAAVMLPAGRGAIVNLASMSAQIVNRDLTQSHYNAAKAGVVHLTKSLAVEWATRGVRVNALSPGYTLTQMTARDAVAHWRAEWERHTPMQRMASMDDLTGPAVFLASDAASFCTGVDLVVDGGYVCW